RALRRLYGPVPVPAGDQLVAQPGSGFPISGVGRGISHSTPTTWCASVGRSARLRISGSESCFEQAANAVDMLARGLVRGVAVATADGLKDAPVLVQRLARASGSLKQLAVLVDRRADHLDEPHQQLVARGLGDRRVKRGVGVRADA